MSSLRSLLDRADRAVSRVPLADDGLERLRRQRDRRRRNQRITAGVVGIAVFGAAVWLVTSDAPTHRGPNPGGTGQTVAPVYPGQVGLIGLAPEGATPSSPSRGELVLEFVFGHTEGDPGRFSVHVYADGRQIWERIGDSSGEGEATGLIEQRLTPEGVEMVQSEVLSTGLFDHGSLHFVSGQGLHYGQIEVSNDDRHGRVTWGEFGPGEPMTVPTPEQVSALKRLDARLEDLATWLPASAWDAPEVRAFVPSRYGISLGTQQEVGLEVLLASLPGPAEDMVRGWTWTQDQANGFHWWSYPATTNEARAIAQSLEDAHNVVVRKDVFGLVYDLGQRVPGTREVSVTFSPMLPHEP